MGLISILSFVTTAASAVAQHRAGKKAERARTESNNIATANEKNQDRMARRELARKERIARAQIANTAEARGSSQSSGELGALAGLAANVDSSVANQSAQRTTAEGISFQQQIAANADQQARNAKLFGQLINTGLDVYEEYTGVS